MKGRTEIPPPPDQADPDTVTTDPFGWCKDGAAMLRRNFAAFGELVDRARHHLVLRDNAAAAAFAEVAAFHAVSSPCGLFASAELDDLLVAIGRREVGRGSPRRAGSVHMRRIIHVATMVQTIGGHGRMIWRWIQSDPSSCHSVVVTRQEGGIPPELTQAVAAQGGTVTRLTGPASRLIEKARQLRQRAASADLIILHIGSRDVVPTLAFAESENRAPVFFLDHGDHLFWLGASIWDAVISLRNSGRRLAAMRRGVPPSRTLLLPIPIQPLETRTAKAEVKQRLGIDAHQLVVLSAARALKYATINGISYADAHLPFLRAEPNAVLVVLGAGRRPDWQSAVDAVGGRILSFPETPDTRDFYDAADIYVDSYPFVSTTSMMEAALRGVPVVSRNPYSPHSAILACDVPGLDPVMIRATMATDYTAALMRLSQDGVERAKLGDMTRRSMLAVHSGPAWREALHEIYRFADSIPNSLPPSAPPTAPCFSEPDVFLPFVHGNIGHPDRSLAALLDLFRPYLRFRLCLDLALRHGAQHWSVRGIARSWFPGATRRFARRFI